MPTTPSGAQGPRRSARSPTAVVRRRDDALSPVIGSIILVAIAIVLSAGVYIFAGGITSGQQAPPAASFRIAGCQVPDHVSYKLASSSENLRLSDLRFLLAPHGSSSASWTNDSATGSWTPGTTVTIAYAGANLTTGRYYESDIVHVPTRHDLASLSFRC